MCVAAERALARAQPEMCGALSLPAQRMMVRHDFGLIIDDFRARKAGGAAALATTPAEGGY